jgi:hypothetical protein
MASSIRSRLRAGSALIEFSLSTMLWVPLLLGTIFIGLNIARAVEVAQVARDAAHMYVSGVDFSQSANQQILVRLASDLGFQVRSGNGVIIFSTITFVGQQDCAAANLPNCANLNQPVFTQRIVVGNTQLLTSVFGSPRSGDIDSSGNISLTSYLNDPGNRALNFNALLPLQSGQYGYVAEAYFASPDLNWPGFLTNSGNYARSIF